MHLLFISPYVPSPIRVRPYNFIKALARRGHTITLICSAGKNDEQALAEMRAICAQVKSVALGSAEMAWNALLALPTAMPFQAALNFSPRLVEVIRQEARSGCYDIAHIEHLRGSALDYGLLNMPVVLDSVDCISLLFERALRGSPSLKSRLFALADLARTRAYEAEYVNRYDRVVVSSPEDAWALEALGNERRGATPHSTQFSAAPAPVVVANGVDLDYFTPQHLVREPATLVFSGKMAYHANEAAALFLAQSIMPLVWARRPDTKVVIAGSSPSRAILALADDPRIRVTGYLPDLRPAIASATLSVCPLRYGVGIQNKVLEAMALETPVIAARQVARALAARDGQELVLAEQAQEYADAIVALLADPERAARLGAAGRRYVERHHDWNVAGARLEALYRDIIGLTNGAPVVHELQAMVAR